MAMHTFLPENQGLVRDAARLHQHVLGPRGEALDPGVMTTIPKWQSVRECHQSNVSLVD
jgi:hypothetical protein